MTLVLAIAFWAIGIAVAGGTDFAAAVRLDPDADVSGVLAMIAWLAEINVLVLLFNLIPAFPLDGGRIARAIAWRVTGDRNRATRFAATLGRGFSYVLIAGGLLLVVGGLVITGIWLALIGFILGQSARGVPGAVRVREPDRRDQRGRRDGFRPGVRSPRTRPSSARSTSTSCATAGRGSRWSTPASVSGGCWCARPRTASPSSAAPRRPCGQVFERDSSATLRVRDDAPLESLLGNDALRRLGGLAAVDADGRLRGVITADQVGRALRDAVSNS